jgi:hypothetical protein
LSKITLAGITAGGLILGTAVQKAALDAYWTGWPVGSNLTDYLTLVVWLAWVVAVLAVAETKDETDRFARTMVVVAAIVTIVVSVLPGSLRG